MSRVYILASPCCSDASSVINGTAYRASAKISVNRFSPRLPADSALREDSCGMALPALLLAGGEQLARCSSIDRGSVRPGGRAVGDQRHPHGGHLQREVRARRIARTRSRHRGTPASAARGRVSPAAKDSSHAGLHAPPGDPSHAARRVSAGSRDVCPGLSTAHSLSDSAALETACLGNANSSATGI